MKSNETSRGLSRRGFLAGAATAALAAGAGLAGCAPSTQDQKGSGQTTTSGMPATWDYEADIVVLGAGGAGYMAAAAAHEKGASSLLIEKSDMTGGDTKLCACLACGPWPERVKQETGKEDSPETYLEDWKNSHQFSVKGLAGEEEVGDLSYVTRLCEKMPEAFAWLEETAGIEWKPFANGAWYPLPAWETRARQWKATNGIVPPLQELVDGFDDSETILETEAYELIKNDDGRVVGVWALEADGTRIAAKAHKAVIVATGSFSGDRAMAQKYLPTGTANLAPGGSPMLTGDGHKMVERIGGSLKEMDLGTHYFGKGLGNASSTMIVSWCYCGDLFGEFAGGVPGVMINCDGKRFVSENMGYNVTATITAQQRNQMCYYVLDSQASENFLTSAAEGDTILSADTLEELARHMGIDESAFTEEIARYNGFVETGTDDDFGKIMEGCAKIEQAPYYAYAVKPMPYATYGGINVDVDSHVLDLAGNPIPGLYAAGICTGSFAQQAGLFYTGGVCQMMVFGRQAGQLAADEEPWE